MAVKGAPGGGGGGGTPSGKGAAAGGGGGRCPDFNGKGCSALKQRDCPHHLEHKCSFMTDRGMPCDSWQHGRQNCPLNLNRAGGKRNNKRKRSGGKGEGKR
jgi:hypothetical protein